MTINTSAFLRKPLLIGSKTVSNRLFFAPMTGLGHIAFRELVSTFGGHGLLFTEMCSAKAIPMENRNVSKVFRWCDQELSYLVCQLVGNQPDIMAKAAVRIEKEGFFGVDINFGCAVSAICKKGWGAALLEDPPLAASLVAAVRKAVSIPVFVKFRIGLQADCEPVIDLAKQFEDAGADALTFHPRVAPDRRSRPPRWDYIRRVKDAVSIPVFGNGNVFDQNDCQKMIKTTGCDGITIGRIAVSKPWIFKTWTEDFIPDPDIYLDCAVKMATLLEAHYDPIMAYKLFKKIAIYFTANFRFGHSIYKKLCLADDIAEIKENIIKLFEEPPETVSRPNMNMFTA